MTRRTKSNIRGKEVPSLSTIQGIWKHLIFLLTFWHREISKHYGQYDEKRIEIHLDQLVKRNLLIKGRFLKREWLVLIYYIVISVTVSFRSTLRIHTDHEFPVIGLVSV